MGMPINPHSGHPVQGNQPCGGGPTPQPTNSSTPAFSLPATPATTPGAHHAPSGPQSAVNGANGGPQGGGTTQGVGLLGGPNQEKVVALLQELIGKLTTLLEGLRTSASGGGPGQVPGQAPTPTPGEAPRPGTTTPPAGGGIAPAPDPVAPVTDPAAAAAASAAEEAKKAEEAKAAEEAAKAAGEAAKAESDTAAAEVAAAQAAQAAAEAQAAAAVEHLRAGGPQFNERTEFKDHIVVGSVQQSATFTDNTHYQKIFRIHTKSDNRAYIVVNYAFTPEGGWQRESMTKQYYEKNGKPFHEIAKPMPLNEIF